MKKAFGVLVSHLLTVILCVGSALAAEQVFFYHTDPAGTPLAMTDSTGKVVWRADYKPFGEEHSVTATTPNDNRFAGKEKDEETGLSYLQRKRPSLNQVLANCYQPIRRACYSLSVAAVIY